MGGLFLRKDAVTRRCTMAFIAVVLAFCFAAVPVRCVLADGPEETASGYGSWVRDKDSGPEGASSAKDLTSRGSADLKNKIPNPAEDEVGHVQTAISELLMDINVSIGDMLKTGGKVDLSATGIIMSHVTSSDGTSFFVFDLTDTNIYGIVGATIYVALRTLALGFLFIFILAKLIVTLYESDVRGLADMKATMLSGLITMILMFVMPQIVDWVCTARNSIADFLYAKLTGYGLGSEVIKEYNNTPHTGGDAPALVSLSGMELEYYKMWGEHKSILNAIIYFAACCAVPIVFAFSYIKIAIQQTILFGMYPAFALVGVKDKNINGKWAAHFFSNVFVPTIDMALLFIPGVIITAIDEGDLVGAMLKAVIVSACFLSVVPARNRLLSMLGNAYGIAPNLGGAIALGAAAVAGLGNIMGGLGEMASGAGDLIGGGSGKDESDQSLGDLAKSLDEIGGDSSGKGDTSGAGGGDMQGQGGGLGEIPGSNDKDKSGDDLNMNDNVSANSEASNILNGGDTNADADIMRAEDNLNQNAEELAAMNQSTQDSLSNDNDFLNSSSAGDTSSSSIDNDSLSNTGISQSDADYVSSGVNSDAYSELNQDGNSSYVGGTDIDQSSLANNGLDESSVSNTGLDQSSLANNGIDQSSLSNESLDQSSSAVGVGSNVDSDSLEQLNMASSSVSRGNTEGNVDIDSATSNATTVNEAPKGDGKVSKRDNAASRSAMDQVLNDTMKNLNSSIENDTAAKQRKALVAQAGANMDMRARNLKEPHKYANFNSNRLNNLEQMSGLQAQSQQVAKAIKNEGAYASNQNLQLQANQARIEALGGKNAKGADRAKVQSLEKENQAIRNNIADSKERLIGYNTQSNAIRTAYEATVSREAQFAQASGNIGMSDKAYTDAASFAKDIQVQERQRKAMSYSNFQTGTEKGYLTPEERVQFQRQESIRKIGSGAGRVLGAAAGAAVAGVAVMASTVAGDEGKTMEIMRAGSTFIGKGASYGGRAGANTADGLHKGYGKIVDFSGEYGEQANAYAGRTLGGRSPESPKIPIEQSDWSNRTHT